MTSGSSLSTLLHEVAFASIVAIKYVVGPGSNNVQQVILLSASEVIWLEVLVEMSIFTE